MIPVQANGRYAANPNFRNPMSIDVNAWISHRQSADVCILTSYGLAASVFTTVRPQDVFRPYAISQGLTASPLISDEQAAESAYAQDQARRDLLGFQLLDYLHTSGLTPFSDVNDVCILETFDLGAVGFPALVTRLTSDLAVAVVCINMPPSAAHAVALAADSKGALWRNDPNGGLCRLNSATEGDVCAGYPSSDLGDIRILRMRSSNAGSAP